MRPCKPIPPPSRTNRNGSPAWPPWVTPLSANSRRFRSPIHLSKAAEADAGAKILGAGPEWLKETTVGLELLGLTPDQAKRALAENRRLRAVNVVQALTQGAPGDEVPAGDQPDVIDGEVDQRALPAGGRRLAAVDGNRGA